MAEAQIYVNTSEIQALLDEMKKKLSREEFSRLMRRTLYEVGNRTRSYVPTPVTKEYAVKKSRVKKEIARPVISEKFGEVQCDIKIEGGKLHVGGELEAEGSFYGYNPPKEGYKIKVKILNGKESVLPAHLKDYGGQPAFRNMIGKNFTGKIQRSQSK